MGNNIGANDALDLIAKGKGLLIDVRETDEFKAEHIAHALSIPLSNLENGMNQLNMIEGQTLIFQCLKGGRGQMACERVQAMDKFQHNIVNLDGGIKGWKQAGLPVLDPFLSSGSKGHKISIFRQVQIIAGLLISIFVALGFYGINAGFILAGLIGIAFLLAGLTGYCGMAILLAKMPWNR